MWKEVGKVGKGKTEKPTRGVLIYGFLLWVTGPLSHWRPTEEVNTVHLDTVLQEDVEARVFIFQPSPLVC